jgi:hypothetical protein
VFVAKKEFNGALYTGAPAIFAEKGVASLLDDKWYEGRLVWHPTACVLTSDDDVGKKIESTACTFGDNHANIRRFLVIGSSFSAAEFEMYSALGESGRGTVTATSSWGASPSWKSRISLHDQKQTTIIGIMSSRISSRT